MYSALSPGAIGVRPANLIEAIAMAKHGGFGGVEFSAHEVADLVEQQDADAVRTLFHSAGIHPAAFGLPTDWRTSDENWHRGLSELPRLAQAAAAIGGMRTMTWIMPGSNDREYEENRRHHIARFTPIATILADNGISLGLEFIGPKTLRDGQKFPFIYTMDAMLEMGQEIGPNVGLLLDCWHWYTSHGTLADLKRLRPDQIAYVHVNDAPPDVPIDAQVDNVRGLPGETGVIDITGFLKSLQSIGYTGPVTPEPFQKTLSALPDDNARLAAVGNSMRTIFARAGIEPTTLPSTA